jgi:putative colanic acid biosynthesis acetyltransferase WcaF
VKKVNLESFSDTVFPTSYLKTKYLGWLIVSNVFFLTNIPYPNYLKVFFLKLFGAKVGNNVVIKPWVKIKLPWQLELKDHIWLGENCWIDNISKITISSNCCISQGALLITGNHDYSKVSFNLITKPIILEEGCWIGANAIVSGGVTIHSHAVLSIGSVTTKDLLPYTIYKGNPAIEYKKRVIS